MMQEHKQIQLYVGLEKGGCVDVGAIKLAGFSMIATSELQALKAERDQALAQNAELVAQVKNLKNDLRQTKLIHIGFTNESQVHYVTEEKMEGSFYPNSDDGCYIPLYMLNIHAHRVGPDSTIYCTQIEQSKKIRALEVQVETLELDNESLMSVLRSKAAAHINMNVAEIKAQAGRAGFVEGYGKCWRESYGTKPNTDSVEEYADSYAERIRRGEV